jgi:hypothetical protein
MVDTSMYVVQHMLFGVHHVLTIQLLTVQRCSTMSLGIRVSSKAASKQFLCTSLDKAVQYIQQYQDMSRCIASRGFPINLFIL